MRLYYTDHFELPLPVGHRFPMSKYRSLRRRIVTDPAHQRDVLLVPPAATDDQLRLCHHVDYLNAVVAGTLTQAQVRRIGFPYSPKMVERSRRSTGATLAAARAALSGDGVSANLAGGTHHAMRDAGEGYCVFNDAAVTLRTLLAERQIRRGVVLDLDVHQGNGTAQITASDAAIWTVSVHGEKNFPLRKFPSDLDVDLPDGTADAEYLTTVKTVLDAIDDEAMLHGDFDLMVYLAGADPFVGDRLGRLAVTKDGLRARDETVLDWAAKRQLPVALAMAGGYAPNVDDIVDIHATTLRVASEHARSQHASDGPGL
ncbi:MAG: histone deacetylase [Planctomycetota bacterium]